MNAVLELTSSHQKLVRDVACLAAEGRLFHRRVHFEGYLPKWRVLSKLSVQPSQVCKTS